MILNCSYQSIINEISIRHGVSIQTIKNNILEFKKTSTETLEDAAEYIDFRLMMGKY